MAAHKVGRLSLACDLYRQILRARPKNAAARHYLGLALMQNREPQAALTELQEAAKALPEDPLVQANHGKVALANQHREEAETAFSKAIALNPSDTESLTNLGTLYRQSGRAADATELLTRSLALKRHPKTAMALGAAERDLGKPEDALNAYKTALQLDPRLTEASLRIAAIQTELGAFSDAAKTLRGALKIRPNHPGALAALLSLKSAEATDDDIAAAEHILNQGQLSKDDRSRLFFGLARVRDRAKDYDAAFKAAEEANKLLARRSPFHANQLQGELQRLQAVFSAERVETLSKHGSPSEIPVLIVGLPRTGTTLTEQIIASHPKGDGAGELPDLAASPARLGYNLKTDYPECLTKPDPALFDALKEEATAYLRALTERFPEAERVADKFPFNFSQVGLFTTLFPKGKIVHCYRDPRDVFLSCYMTEFNEGLEAFRSTQENFVAYLSLYRSIMAHWDEVLPGRIHHQRYETLVGDFQSSAEALIAHLGLPWHDDCSRFFETERAVRTPSRWQVRQPIYTSSRGKWENYARHLSTLQKYLDEAGLPDWSGLTK